jgi:tetratricopeptide (TPR) repeat protein
MLKKLLLPFLLIDIVGLIGTGVAQTPIQRQCFFENSDLDLAINSCTAVIDSGLDPERLALALQRRGVVYVAKRQFDRAIQDFDRAIQLKPNDPRILASIFNGRGGAYGGKTQYDRAIDNYDQAVRLEPKNGVLFRSRGFAYALTGKNDRAIEDFNEAIRLASNDATALVGRGESYRAMGQYDRAIQDYNQAIRLDPNLADAFQARGAAYADKKDYDRAIQDFDEAIRRNPNDVDALDDRRKAETAKRTIDRQQPPMKQQEEVSKSLVTDTLTDQQLQQFRGAKNVFIISNDRHIRDYVSTLFLVDGQYTIVANKDKADMFVTVHVTTTQMPAGLRSQGWVEFSAKNVVPYRRSFDWPTGVSGPDLLMSILQEVRNGAEPKDDSTATPSPLLRPVVEQLAVLGADCDVLSDTGSVIAEARDDGASREDTKGVAASAFPIGSELVYRLIDLIYDHPDLEKSLIKSSVHAACVMKKAGR